MRAGACAAGTERYLTLFNTIYLVNSSGQLLYPPSQCVLLISPNRG
jgi:hypothetical protein